MKRVLGGALVALVGVGAWAPAAQPMDAPVDTGPGPLSAATYLALFDDAGLRGVELPPPDVFDLFVDITGNDEVDDRIQAAAEARGYRRQPLVTVDLVAVDGRRLQASAAEAWVDLKAAARADGVSLILTSAYRDVRDQRSLFRGRLGGRTSEAAIDATLATAAPPGYSKHHTGYAIDIGQAGVADAGFINTRAYAWLAAFDFALPKAFGFIPSYPQGGEEMGPDPEPWEFVWVGQGRIACAIETSHPTGFCDAAPSERIDDIAWLVDLGVTVGCRPGRYCSDDPVTRGEAASMLWRLRGAPAPPGSAPFVDVFDDDQFAAAVAWLHGVGLVEGTSASTFSPDEFLAPNDALALVLRLAAFEGPDAIGLRGPIPDFAGEPVSVGDLGAQISRAEFASVLRAIASTS